MIRNVSTRETRGFILEPLLVLGMVAGLLLAHAIGSAQELPLGDRLLLGAALAVAYGGAAALACGILLIVSRVGGGRTSRVDGRFAVIIGLVPCLLFLLVSLLDVQRVRRATEDRIASWRTDGASRDGDGTLLLILTRDETWTDLERRRSEGEAPPPAVGTSEAATLELDVPRGATDASLRRVITTGRPPKRPSVAGRHIYRLPGLRSPLSDDVPRGVGLITLIDLGASVGLVEARPADDPGERGPHTPRSITDAVELAGGRSVVLVDPTNDAAVASARAALDRAPGLVLLDVARYDARVDTLVAMLTNTARVDPALLVVALGEPRGLLVSSARSPRRIDPARAVSWTDVYPTALSLLGLSVPPDAPGRTLDAVLPDPEVVTDGAAR
jgi:hypothetical protein